MWQLTEPDPVPVSNKITSKVSAVSETVERVAKLKMQVAVENQQQLEMNVNEGGAAASKPQSLARLKIDIIKNHQANKI